LIQVVEQPLLIKDLLRIGRKPNTKSTKWSTKAGSFKTKKKCEIEFTLPAFHANRDISCNAYVDESPPESSNYDMIIGRDIMHSLGINILFDTAEISWDNARVKMQPPERVNGT
jgi:hypothetical protein